MKTRPALCVLSFACLLLGAHSQGNVVPHGCVLGDMLQLDPPDFPDIEKLAVESYQMNVEFTLPGVRQTDYYTEFYDIALGRGRVDSHQDGRNLKFIYRQDSWESWNIEGDSCQLLNITDTPTFFKDYQMNWMYEPSPDRTNQRTIGPSAMFKNALKQWKKGNTVDSRKMAYLGELHGPIRGIRAQAWRWCQTPDTSVDYFFTVDNTDNAYDLKSMKLFPLRVTFNGNWTGDEEVLSQQYYDIMTFQPYISLGLHPFQLPKGKNCRRKPLYPPTLPDFNSMNMMFNAEVLYRKIRSKDKEEIVSFYSKFMFAVDNEAKLISFFYSPWNTTKEKNSDGDVVTKYEVAAPKYTVFDTKYNYAYTVDYETGQCQIGRQPGYVPVYWLPNNAGGVNLFDRYILFPNNELSYLTRTQERGMDVDVFEAYVQNYTMYNRTVKKVIVTHSYLPEGEILEANVAIKNAPTQIELHLFDTDDVEEIVTFNMFGFSTKLRYRRSLFDVTRCFKNDDDYSWVTLGFESAEDKSYDMTAVPVRQIQRNIMEYLDIDVSLRPTRVPFIMVDAREELYVTLLLLQKPPVQLDFTEVVNDKSVDTADSKQVLGLVDDSSVCATACLEEKKNCWGYSVCGDVCYFGTSPDTPVKDQKGCTLFKRYNNETYLRSKEAVIEDLHIQADSGNIKLKLNIKDEEVQVKATSISVTDPAEDDTTFRRMGNKVNPRMRTLKVGAKLKKGEGKSLGMLQFSQCQQLCLDYNDCETVSFCLIDSDCVISTEYGDEIKADNIETDLTCQMVTRKYADNFDRSPGLFLEVDASKTLDVEKTEDCARACLKETGFECLSFDHCPREDKAQCRLHKTHFLNKKTQKESLKAKPNCGHYSRKYSTSFKKNADSKIMGSKVAPITDLTLEECAKTCVDYADGGCYGFDFCKGSSAFETSCLIIDNDPSRLDSVYSSACSSYLRTEAVYAPRPYTTGYAGGIGFLCFVVGGVVGVIIIFAIAYFRVNRR